MSDYWIGFVFGMFITIITSMIICFIIDPFGQRSNLLKGYSELHYQHWKTEHEYSKQNTSVTDGISKEKQI